ncbi:unnamed protein product [Gongylonema pulchrum]|uniref:Small ribosomal subunit protein mS29 n=1 Tax=Gongylonema pulchrum TaxID=637853 RepID=A0A3P6PGZ9_9BILA|nr:unnamed protein product [Gongylonema pulchrum]
MYYRNMLPPKFRKQVDTLDECVWLYRRPTLEATNLGVNVPNLRMVLWGRWGTGKSMTVFQTIYCVWNKNATFSAMQIMRDYIEVKMSTYRDGRIDFPVLGHQILNRFKLMNTPHWHKLKVFLCSEFAMHELSDFLSSNTGLAAPSLSCDCVGGLIRELTYHCSAGKFPLLVTIDHANSLYGKTTLKDTNHKLVDAKYFSLVHHLRKLLQRNDWTNGACLLVADKREVSDARDHLTVPLETPLELFGEHVENIEPFIPIETSLYTADEMDTLYEYYLEKNWIASQTGRTERAKKELRFLSAGSPYNYERLCAFI